MGETEDFEITASFTKQLKFTDDLGREIRLEKARERVVSLVPSITETLVAIGKSEVIKGVTRFCIHPADIRRKATVIGGTKTIKTALIRKLHPDLIIAEKNENRKEQVLELATEFPVFVFDINTFEDGLRMIETCGKLLHSSAAFELAQRIRSNFSIFKKETTPTKALYLIWKKPWMAAGKNTFIGSMMEKAGLVSVVEKKYPEVSKSDFQKAEIILLSSEPYPFKERDKVELQKQYPDKKIIAVDGELFAWYGARMEKAVDFLLQMRNSRK